MGRVDLPDAEWELTGPLLPPEHGRDRHAVIPPVG